MGEEEVMTVLELDEIIKQVREANLYNPIESPANTFLALSWYNACDDIERIVEGERRSHDQI
uniref:Uncharacterized protein n=1 Tax=viral metagenome TaxID=1070528 RepID=A0A6M3IEA6_9ZZZZ